MTYETIYLKKRDVAMRNIENQTVLKAGKFNKTVGCFHFCTEKCAKCVFFIVIFYRDFNRDFYRFLVFSCWCFCLLMFLNFLVCSYLLISGVFLFVICIGVTPMVIWYFLLVVSYFLQKFECSWKLNF